MSAGTPPTFIATYRVKAGHEEAFIDLLNRHYPTLMSLGLVTDDPPTVYVGKDDEGGPVFYEIFSWKDGDAAGVAHESPEVMAIWEPMGQHVEERGGHPKFEFPHVEPVTLNFD